MPVLSTSFEFFSSELNPEDIETLKQDENFKKIILSVPGHFFSSRNRKALALAIIRADAVGREALASAILVADETDRMVVALAIIGADEVDRLALAHAILAVNPAERMALAHAIMGTDEADRGALAGTIIKVDAADRVTLTRAILSVDPADRAHIARVIIEVGVVVDRMALARAILEVHPADRIVITRTILSVVDVADRVAIARTILAAHPAVRMLVINAILGTNPADRVALARMILAVVDLDDRVTLARAILSVDPADRVTLARTIIAVENPADIMEVANAILAVNPAERMTLAHAIMGTDAADRVTLARAILAIGPDNRMVIAHAILWTDSADRGALAHTILVTNPADRVALAHTILVTNPADRIVIARAILGADEVDRVALARVIIGADSADRVALASAILALDPANRGALARAILWANSADRGALTRAIIRTDAADRVALASAILVANAADKRDLARVLGKIPPYEIKGIIPQLLHEKCAIRPFIEKTHQAIVMEETRGVFQLSDTLQLALPLTCFPVDPITGPGSLINITRLLDEGAKLLLENVVCYNQGVQSGFVGVICLIANFQLWFRVMKRRMELPRSTRSLIPPDAAAQSALSRLNLFAENSPLMVMQRLILQLDKLSSQKAVSKSGQFSPSLLGKFKPVTRPGTCSLPCFVNPDTGEVMLIGLHGTSEENMQKIAAEGFKTERSKDTCLYGKGIYFAFEADKAKQENYLNGNKYVFLVAVFLEKEPYIFPPGIYKLPPGEKAGLALPGYANDGRQFHYELVVGEGTAIFPLAIVQIEPGTLGDLVEQAPVQSRGDEPSTCLTM